MQKPFIIATKRFYFMFALFVYDFNSVCNFVSGYISRRESLHTLTSMLKFVYNYDTNSSSVFLQTEAVFANKN